MFRLEADRLIDLHTQIGTDTWRSRPGLAIALGLGDRLESLEPGKVADVIATEGNPLDDIQAMTRIRLVVSRGCAMHAAEPGGRSDAESRIHRPR
jgi:hypothetical protein